MKYFHGITIVRRRRNLVSQIQDEGGAWITDPKTLEEMVTLFYRNVFLNDGSVNR